MTPPRWTHEDEELWHRYACAALAGQMGQWRKDTVLAARVADVADAMLEAHLQRFPRDRDEPPKDERPASTPGQEERCGR